MECRVDKDSDRVKRCQSCSEWIKEAAKLCRFCQSKVSDETVNDLPTNKVSPMLGSMQSEQVTPQTEQQLNGSYIEGQTIQVLWSGNWLPATILKLENGRYLIHYNGTGRQWDEWIDSSRVRPPDDGNTNALNHQTPTSSNLKTSQLSMANQQGPKLGPVSLQTSKQTGGPSLGKKRGSWQTELFPTWNALPVWQKIVVGYLVLCVLCAFISANTGGSRRGPSAATRANMQQYMSDKAYKEAYSARDALDHGDMRGYREHAAAAGSAVNIYEEYGGR